MPGFGRTPPPTGFANPTPGDEPDGAGLKAGSVIDAGGVPIAGITAAIARQTAAVLARAAVDRQAPAPFPADGSELWFAVVRSESGDVAPQYEFLKLHGLDDVHGPEITLNTTEFPEQRNIARDSANMEINPTFQIPHEKLNYGKVIGRYLYNPYRREHTGINGMLGMMRTAAVVTWAKTFRNSQTDSDWLYQPSFLLEWIGDFVVTKYSPRKVGAFHWVDFELAPQSEPIFYESVPGPSPYDLQAMPDTLAPTLTLSINTVIFSNAQTNVQTSAALPAQSPPPGTAFTYSYSVFGLPPGIQFLPTTRELRVAGEVSVGGGNAISGLAPRLYTATYIVTRSDGQVAYYNLPIQITGA